MISTSPEFSYAEANKKASKSHIERFIQFAEFLCVFLNGPLSQIQFLLNLIFIPIKSVIDLHSLQMCN